MSKRKINGCVLSEDCVTEFTTRLGLHFTEFTIRHAHVAFFPTTTGVAARESNLSFYSQQRLKHSELAIRPRIHTKSRNKGEYIDRRCNSVVTRKKVL